MSRPKLSRNLQFKPEVVYFKPRGVPLSILGEVELFPDELESLKLHNVDGFSQIESSKKMNVSQPTFGRILNTAYRKIASAIVEGKAIKITKREN